jgi:hypothetical protein
VRILCLGDSRTFGWGLKEEETYPELLVSLLQKQNLSRKIEVINAGVNAWSYPQMLVYLRNTAIRYEPDILILGEANLWTQFSEKNSPEFVRKFTNRVRMKNVLRRFATYHFVVEVKLKEFYERNRTRFIPIDPAQGPCLSNSSKVILRVYFEAQSRKFAGWPRNTASNRCYCICRHWTKLNLPTRQPC